MRVKGGVVLPDAVAMWLLLEAVERAWEAVGEEPTITSGKDGRHKKGSLHYVGRALDLRTRDLSPAKITRVVGLLERDLEDAGFDVVLESDHIHVEYDPHS